MSSTRSTVRGEAPETTRDELLKLERDIQIGREIQQGFLPASLPEPSGWQVSAAFRPAREVAGDFYDVFYMAKGRRLGFVMADVCDKGVGAALFMALFRTLVRSNAQQTNSLSWLDSNSPAGGSRRAKSANGGSSGIDSAGSRVDDAEEWLTGSAFTARNRLPSIGSGALLNAVAGTNDYVVENHMSQGYFVTLFFGVLDFSNGQLLYINAGHNPPAIVRSDGTLELLRPSGPAVGIVSNARFEIRQARLEPGEVLYTYTDGVTEARSATGEFFGESRLFDALRNGAASAQELVDDLEARLEAHTAGSEQYDDITMLALRRDRA